MIHKRSTALDWSVNCLYNLCVERYIYNHLGITNFLSIPFFYSIIIQHESLLKQSQCVKIRNRYNQVAHLTQDIKGKVTYSQLDTTNESQSVSSFPTGDNKAQINRHAQRHYKHKAEKHK